MGEKWYGINNMPELRAQIIEPDPWQDLMTSECNNNLSRQFAQVLDGELATRGAGSLAVQNMNLYRFTREKTLP